MHVLENHQRRFGSGKCLHLSS
jgi:hypothetical protein